MNTKYYEDDDILKQSKERLSFLSYTRKQMAQVQ